MNTQCAACKQNITTGKPIKCSVCDAYYHKICVNATSIDTNKKRDSWSCPSCRSKSPRTYHNNETPVQLSSSDADINGSNVNVQSRAHKRAAVGSPVSERHEAENSKSFADLISEIRYLRTDMVEVKTTLKSLLDDIFKFNGRLDNYDDRLKCLEQSNPQSLIEKLERDFTQTTDFIASEQNDLKVKLEATNKIVHDLELEKSQTLFEMSKLQRRLFTIEKTSRCRNLEVQAVPEHRNENVDLIFKKLCEKLGVLVSESDIISCRRVAKLNPISNRPRNILVTLRSERLRDHVISGLKRYNKEHPNNSLNSGALGISGESRKIYLSEHLSPECKDLHAAARHAAKAHSFRFVWVKYGRVYLKKDIDCPAIHIKSKDCLNKLT